MTDLTGVVIIHKYRGVATTHIQKKLSLYHKDVSLQVNPFPEKESYTDFISRIKRDFDIVIFYSDCVIQSFVSDFKKLGMEIFIYDGKSGEIRKEVVE